MLRTENVISFYFISKANNWKVVRLSGENFSFEVRTGSILLLSLDVSPWTTSGMSRRLLSIICKREISILACRIIVRIK